MHVSGLSDKYDKELEIIKMYSVNPNNTPNNILTGVYQFSGGIKKYIFLIH